MGRAKAKRDRAKEVRGMSFPEQLQHYASKIVREATDLIDLGGCKWVMMEAADGTKSICLSFPSTMWELVRDELRLKTNESNKDIETGKESTGSLYSDVVGNVVR